ncbi:MAG: efflux RND transporter periplasmic adaptor subunit [Labilithrix sp.]|nr:efflux RND transporter periplasmic adaptor subunit [Labilithrix sp.]
MSSGEASARRPIIPVAIVGLVLGVVACGGYLLHRAESGVNQIALADEPKSVTVIETKQARFRDSRRYIGTLEPWQEAKIGPQLASGFVDTVLVRPGSIVKRGDVLATLDCRNASAASAAIAHQARALEERQKAAASEAARLNQLLDGGYAAPNEVEQKAAQAAANAAQIQAILAQGSGKALEVNDCVLRAPFAGEVATRLADPGAFVRPGSAIVDLVDRSVVRLTAFVPEIDFEAVPPKTPVRLRLVATGKTLTGEVARRAPSADLSTRTVRFEVDLPNAERDIPTGTTAEIEVDVGDTVDAVELPLVAAKVRGKKATVFVVEDGVAKKTQVDVLGERASSLYVKPELGSGARVVTQGRSLLGNNDKVAAKVEASAK